MQGDTIGTQQNEIADLKRLVKELKKERYLPVPCPQCDRVRLLYTPTNHRLECEKCGADNNMLVFFQEELQRGVKEARKHWKSCEEGWNRTIKQAEDFLKERDELKRTLIENEIEYEEWASTVLENVEQERDVAIEQAEKAEEKQVALVTENEYLLEQIETLKETLAILKYWQRIKNTKNLDVV